MCASVTKQYNLVPSSGVISLAEEVTAGLMESKDSLPQGLWLSQPAKIPGSAPCPTLVQIEYGTTLYLLYCFDISHNFVELKTVPKYAFLSPRF